MNVLKRLLVVVLLIGTSITGLAQSKISGVVRGADGTPLSGVTVTVRGTTRSAQTNSQGTYTITASVGETLRFTYVGFEPADVRVGDNTSYNVSLKPGDNTLETVTVAMDMKRNPKELGFSVQKLNGNELAETQRENFVDAMQGRIAGLTVTPTSGMAGSSSQLVLRGFNSISLDNGPLFVIDGVIVDNQTLNESGGAFGVGGGMGLASGKENRTNDYSSRISDINPNDIETITVLKGPEATALYGSQASSGAIVITTKKGNNTGRVSISYDNSFRFSKQTRYPQMQTLYDAGVNGVPNTTFSYFGPAFDGGTQLYNNDPAKVFFRTGFAQTHNLSAEYGKNNYTFRVSGSAFNQEATVPTNTYKRYNFRISNTTKIGKWIDIAPSFTYINSNNSKPIRGLTGFLLNMLQWPADDDITKWQNDDAEGTKKLIYASNAIGELDNPFFNVYKNRSADRTNRIQGTLGVNMNPFKWLSLNGRFGYDKYHSEGYTVYHPASWFMPTRTEGGRLDNYYRDYKGYNHSITGTLKHKIGKFGGRLVGGTQWQDNETHMFAIYGRGIADSVSLRGVPYKNGVAFTDAEWDAYLGTFPDSSLTNPGTRLKTLNAARTGTDIPNKNIYRQLAYFVEASINWNSAIFLTYSHRFEESSVFPKRFREYNYPAGSVSVMLTDLFPAMKGKVLNYLKLRGSRANTARTSSPYSNQSALLQNQGSGGGYYYGFTNANPFLKPELQRTYEYGTEVRMFNNRFNVDFTYYNTNNENLIVELFRTSYGTGFVLNTLNVGGNKNTGIEIALDAVPIQTNNLKWSVRMNFNRMRNEVLELPANVPEFYISDTWLYGNARGGLVVGGPTTSITSYGYQRNNNGDVLINPANGLPVVDATFKVRGDRNPDFTLGTINTLTYKNLRVSMLWDLRVGGDVYNGTEMFLTRVGRSKRTTDRMTPRVIEGVLNDGLQNTSNPTRNTIAVVPYYTQEFFTLMPEEEYIEKDINAFRLRDLSVNYTFSQSRLKGLKYFKSLSVFVTANELVLITNYSGADPSVNGNTAGSRGVGAFGFDYANVGTPISFNLGFKANF